MLHKNFIQKALDLAERGAHHWFSKLPWEEDGWHCFRVRVGGGKRIKTTHLRALWMVIFGRPIGTLSNVCGLTQCINPYHYSDQSDREQAAWKEDIPREEESEWCEVTVRDVGTQSDKAIKNDLGLTNDFGCYHCSKRFDPLKSRNKVVCDECWTDTDQEYMENAND